MRIIIKIQHESRKFAESIAKSVTPDNLEAPPNVFVKTQARGKITTSVVKCERLETFITTVDDLLLCIDAAQKTLEEVKTDRSP
ncbi:KEOPS complex subunit Pcc1 [[Eubacterium] cellulosolvens]